MGHKVWKIVDLLQTTSEYFKQKQIENPRLNAEMLLGHVLGLRRVDLYLAYDRPLSASELAAYRELVLRRSRGEPLQYLLGYTEFMGFPFAVTPAVLIPRPETELLVEQALTFRQRIPAARVLDVGTGSGCIAVSLKKMWPEAEVWGADVSAEALKIAALNGERNQVRVRWEQWDMRDPWPRQWPQMDLLISNPPYIRLEEWDALPREVREHEPRTALTDEGDGLRYYRRLLELFFSPHSPIKSALLLELSGSQPGAVLELVPRDTTVQIQVLKDLTGIERVLKIVKKE